MTTQQKERPLSKEFYTSLCEKIPGGVNSPIRSFQKVGQLPIIVEEGKGPFITDIDGHTYIDFVGRVLFFMATRIQRL